MDLFTCAIALGAAISPISEGYIEYTTPAQKQEYVCYANLKDYQNILYDAGISAGLFNEFIYANGELTGNPEYKHITLNAGLQFKFKNFTPYIECSANYLDDEKSPHKESTYHITGFYEKELNAKAGIKINHELFKFFDFFGDFSLGYEIVNELGINIEKYDSENDIWKDTSKNCSYLEDMFRANLRIGLRLFKVFSVYAGIQSWQTIGYSEDTGSIFGGSTPCMIRNDIGFEFKTNFKRFNPYLKAQYFCQHPEKPFDYYNKTQHPEDYLSEQFNYNHMEVKAGMEIRF